MHATFEYVLAGIVLLVILSTAEMHIFGIMAFQLAKMEQETEYPIAEKILDTLLLSPGNPGDWGNQSGIPSSFGLAVQNSLRSYTLDVRKVAKLVNGSPGYMLPSTARDLMGLSSIYNFNLTITPMFNINITMPSSNTYLIKVIDYKGLLVSNAYVTGFYVPTSMSGDETFSAQSAVTGLYGSCTLVFNPLPGHFLVVSVSQMAINNVQTYPVGMKVTIEGGIVKMSDFPIIQTIIYATGQSPELIESVIRYVDINNLGYCVKFELWE